MFNGLTMTSGNFLNDRQISRISDTYPLFLFYVVTVVTLHLHIKGVLVFKGLYAIASSHEFHQSLV